MAGGFLARTREFLSRSSKSKPASEESAPQKTSDDTSFNSDATLIADTGADSSKSKHGSESKHKSSKKSGRKRKSEDTIVIIPANAKRVRSKNKTTSDPRGSPWDKPKRKKINIKDLDLKRSYVEFLKDEPGLEDERPRRRTRWKYAGSTPLTDVERIPEGWSTAEPDLDPEDIDAQIVRCKERIDDNIMTFLFERRLEDLERAKADLEARDGKEREGLDKHVYKRLETLRNIEKSLKENGDKYKQLVNVYAILRAYRTKKITWNRLVTYWSKGTQLCEPRPFDMDEFDAINEAYYGHESFWVEGFLPGPGPSNILASIDLYATPRTNFTIYYNLAVKIPEVNWWSELQFVHDTGASIMTMYEEDIDTMLGPFHPGARGQTIPQLPVLGTVSCSAWNHTSNTYSLHRLEVAVLDRNGKRMTPWARVPVILQPGRPPMTNSHRLDGPLLHYLLFVFSSPDNTGKMTASTSKARFSLANSAPEADRGADYGNARFVSYMTRGTGKTFGKAYRDMRDIHQKEFDRVSELN